MLAIHTDTEPFTCLKYRSGIGLLDVGIFLTRMSCLECRKVML